MRARLIHLGVPTFNGDVFERCSWRNVDLPLFEVTQDLPLPVLRGSLQDVKIEDEWVTCEPKTDAPVVGRILAYAVQVTVPVRTAVDPTGGRITIHPGVQLLGAYIADQQPWEGMWIEP